MAQVIAFAALPILSRLYTPEDFAVLGIFVSVVSVFSIFGNGGYESAIMLPEEKEDRFSLLTFSFYSAIGVALLSLFSHFFLDHFNVLEKASLRVFYIIPFAVFFESAAQALKVWLNKEKRYKSLSKVRLFQALTTALVSLGMAYFTNLPFGLILGLLAGFMVKFFGYFIASSISFSRLLKPNFSKIKYNLNRFNQFVKFGIWGTSLNTISRQLPYFILPIYFGEYFTGQFSMSMKILMLPIGLVSVAVGDVYFEKANSAFQKGGTELAALTRKTFTNLSILAILMILVGIPLAPFAFTFVLGDQWTEAGRIAQFLLPWIALMFVSSPLSYLIDIHQKLKVQLFYNVLLFSFRFAVLLAGANLFSEMETIKYFGFGNTIFVAGFLFYLLKLANVRK